MCEIVDLSFRISMCMYVTSYIASYDKLYKGYIADQLLISQFFKRMVLYGQAIQGFLCVGQLAFEGLSAYPSCSCL